MSSATTTEARCISAKVHDPFRCTLTGLQALVDLVGCRLVTPEPDDGELSLDHACRKDVSKRLWL